MGTCHSKCCGHEMLWEGDYLGLALMCPHAFTRAVFNDKGEVDHFERRFDGYVDSIRDLGETTTREAMKLVQDAILWQEYNVDDVD